MGMTALPESNGMIITKLKIFRLPDKVGAIEYELKTTVKAVAKNGKIIEGSSLKQIVSDLPDFKKEKMLLEYYAEQLGVHIVCSTKYHPEITGEDIEYCWGIAKNWYCRRPLEDKKGRDKFLKLVKECICNENVTTITSVCKFGQCTH